MTDPLKVEVIDGGPIGLASKLAAVLAAVGRIPKRGHNSAVGDGYDYVMDADVLDTVRTALAEQDVATLVGVTDYEHLPFTTARGSQNFLTTIKGLLTFIDGVTQQSISVPFVGVGADTMDKGYYKAVTGGVKYALLKIFLVPTGDDPEVPNEEEKAQARESRQPRAAQRSAPAGTPAEPERPRIVGQGPGLTDNQRKKLMALYRERNIEGDQRHAFQFLVTGKNSTREMAHADFEKLLDVLENPTEPVNAEHIANAQIVKARKDE